MKKEEAITELQNMSIGEKIAALSQTDKAFIRGYVERAIIESRKIRRKSSRKKTTERKRNEEGTINK
jgi:hypothetical protein